MKIRNILVIFAVAALMMGCHHQPAAVVTGTVEGRSGDSLVLMYLAFNTLEPVDTFVTDAQGAFRCKVALPSGLPEFYYLYEGQTQRAAVVLHHGDRVNVSIKDGDYSVEGSDDSQFLYDANASFAAARGEMLSLTEDYLGASSSSLQKDIRTRMGRVFVDYNASTEAVCLCWHASPIPLSKRAFVWLRKLPTMVLTVWLVLPLTTLQPVSPNWHSSTRNWYHSCLFPFSYIICPHTSR